MPVLYIGKEITYFIGGGVELVLSWPDSPFGPLTKREAFNAQPDPWTTDADLIPLVAERYPGYEIRMHGQEEDPL